MLLHDVLELSAFSRPNVRRNFQTTDIICSESDDAELGAQPRKLAEAYVTGRQQPYVSKRTQESRSCSAA